MIGAIVGLLDIVKSANAIATAASGNNSGRLQNIKDTIGFLDSNRDALNKLAGKTRSIASMANKRLQEYPLIISNAFGDNMEVAMNITKFSEACFAYFLLISIGIEPVVGNGRSLSAHIAQFGTESIMRANIKTNNKLTVDEEMAFINAMEEYSKLYTTMNDNLQSAEDIADRVYNKYTPYFEYQPDPQGKIGYHEVNGKMQVYKVTKDSNGNDIYIDKNGRPVNIGGVFQDPNIAPDPTNAIVVQRGNKVIGGYKNPIGAALDNGLIGDNYKIPKQLEDRMGKSLPTTITVELIVEDHKIPIKLGVKAIPHFITSEEMSALIKRCIEGGSILRKFLRLTTGEFSFFKDFLFNLTQIKEDQKMYAKLERHPWYRMLLDRKIKSTVNTLGGLHDKMSSMMKDQAILPTVTLVTTVEEISDAMSYPYYDAVKNGKIEKIINHLMLLGLFVYDSNREVLNCHFGGVKQVHVIKAKDLKGSDKKNDNEEFIKAMQTLLIKNY